MMSEQDYRNYSPPGSESNDSAIGAMFKVAFALIICGLIAIAFDGCGGGDSEPKVTPAPVVVVENNDVEIIQAIGEILQPVVDASANAQVKDMNTAHPPSTAEMWGPTLTALATVACIVSGMVVVALVLIVVRSGVLVKLVHALDKPDDKKSETAPEPKSVQTQMSVSNDDDVTLGPKVESKIQNGYEDVTVGSDTDA